VQIGPIRRRATGSGKSSRRESRLTCARDALSIMATSATPTRSSFRDIAYSESPAASRAFAPLLILAQNENGLWMDAVVLHGIRCLVALHEGLERLHVGDLGYQRCLV